MNPADPIPAAEIVGVTHVIPFQHNTFPVFAQDFEKFKADLDAQTEFDHGDLETLRVVRSDLVFPWKYSTRN